jgi:hypothetical protein
MTREEIAKTIEGFVNGTGSQWDWDDFTSIRLKDPELEAIRERCISIRDEFPPSDPHAYCSEAGLEVMRRLVADLRSRAGDTRTA